MDKANLKITFQDQGQDLLWMTIDSAKLIVVNAGDFKSDELFSGAQIRSKKILVDGFLEIFHKKHGSCLIKYPITGIEPIE